MKYAIKIRSIIWKISMFNLSKKKIMAFAIAFTMLFASQVNVQEIYEALKCNVLCRGYEQGQDEIAEKEIQNDEPEISNDSSEKRQHGIRVFL